MYRHVLRACRCLARPKINTYKLLTPRSYSSLTLLRKNWNSVCSFRRQISVSSGTNTSFQDPEDAVTFDQVCNETLESLCDYFEELIEDSPNFKGADVTYGDGVLTVSLGKNYGTYVINRQKPNKQIWLSSPTSGPKRYDLVSSDGGYWVYKHDGITLHALLQEEISKLTESKVDFKKCTHSL